MRDLCNVLSIKLSASGSLFCTMDFCIYLYVYVFIAQSIHFLRSKILNSCLEWLRCKLCRATFSGFGGVNNKTEIWLLHTIYRVSHKNVALYFCPYLRQLMTDFQNFFTVTLCGHHSLYIIVINAYFIYILQGSVKTHYNIPSHRKCVFSLLCETWM